MRPRIDRSVVTVPPRVREGMSSRHLDDLRALPCAVCGRLVGGRSDPHHLLRGLPVKERGMGRRASDQYAIPACRQHHEELHAAADDEAYLTRHGIDGRALARALWAARGDRKAMLRVMARTLNQRGIFIG